MSKNKHFSFAVDCVGLAGFAEIFYGLYEIYPPAAFIASGGLLTIAAFLMARP